MDILGTIAAIINIQQVEILALLMVANFGTGVVASFVTGTWDWSKMGDIWKRVGGLFGAYVVMSAPAYYIADWEKVQVAITVLLSGKLVEYILKNLKEMGIPVPDSLAGLPVVKEVVGVTGLVVGTVTRLPGRLLTKK
jgi:phage-related holin